MDVRVQVLSMISTTTEAAIAKATPVNATRIIM